VGVRTAAISTKKKRAQILLDAACANTSSAEWGYLPYSARSVATIIFFVKRCLIAYQIRLEDVIEIT